MKTQFDQALARLAPIEDHVLLGPMQPDELQILESKLGQELPHCLRHYYESVGPLEDLTTYGSCDYEMHGSIEDIIQSTEWLPEALRKDMAVSFAIDVVSDEIYVVGATPCDQMYSYDRRADKIHPLGNFCDWFEQTVDRVLATIDHRPPNSQKRWYVQFAFECSSEAPVLAAFATLAELTNVSSQWRVIGTSRSNVTSAELTFTWDKKHLALHRLTCPEWNQPQFFVDYSEPVLLYPERSIIRQLNAVFEKASTFRYQRIDYGPLRELDTA